MVLGITNGYKASTFHLRGAGVSHCHQVLGPREMKQQTLLWATPQHPQEHRAALPQSPPPLLFSSHFLGPLEDAGGRRQQGLLINEESDQRTGMNYPGSRCPFGQNELSPQITSLTSRPPSLRGLPKSLTPVSICLESSLEG